jgi:hypothetical protein
MSIAASSAAVDVVRDSVEQAPLYRRTTHSQLPAMCAAEAGFVRRDTSAR